MKLKPCPNQYFSEERCANSRKLRLLCPFVEHRPEWIIIEQAAGAFCHTLVPLHDTLGDASLVYIVKQIRMQCIVSVECSPILNRLIHVMTTLESIILLDSRLATVSRPAAYDVERFAHTASFFNLLQDYCIVKIQQDGKMNQSIYLAAHSREGNVLY